MSFTALICGTTRHNVSCSWLAYIKDGLGPELYITCELLYCMGIITFAPITSTVYECLMFYMERVVHPSSCDDSNRACFINYIPVPDVLQSQSWKVEYSIYCAQYLILSIGEGHKTFSGDCTWTSYLQRLSYVLYSTVYFLLSTKSDGRFFSDINVHCTVQYC